MTQKTENFLNEKNAKITKQAHAFKGYASSCNVEILNSSNTELQLKDRESSNLQFELKGFKLITVIVLEFEKIQSDDKALCSTFYLHSKAGTIINESDIDEAFESIYSTVIQTYKISRTRFRLSYLFSHIIIILIFRGTNICLVAVISNY